MKGMIDKMSKRQILITKMWTFVGIIILLFLLLSLFNINPFQGEQNENVGDIGIIKLPDGEVIKGKIESLTRINNLIYIVKIDNVNYYIHPSDFACYEDKDGGEGNDR